MSGGRDTVMERPSIPYQTSHTAVVQANLWRTAAILGRQSGDMLDAGCRSIVVYLFVAVN